MNKQSARRYAQRMISGLIDQHINGKGKTVPRDPLVYDWPYEDQGKRLSDEDENRVHLALEELQDSALYKGNRGEPERSSAQGKPGSRWKGYADQRKRQGYAR